MIIIDNRTPQEIAECAARTAIVEDRRDAATGAEAEIAREVIRTAQALGWDGPEPSLAGAYDLYLLEDADEAMRWIIDQDEPDPDRCTECGCLQLCDCLIYPAAYGRIVPEFAP